MSPRKIAVILGAGPGLGSSLAKALIPTHSLLLLSRSLPSSLPKLGSEISNLPSDRLLALSSDGSRDSLVKAFEEVKRKWPDSRVDLGVYNVGGFFVYGDFLDSKEEDFQHGLQNGV
jgi:NAD(P)-dependent dehydrogenase (short-subunit alcohol dehydrogenase family)